MKNLKINVIMFNVDSTIYDNPEYSDKAMKHAMDYINDRFPEITSDVVKDNSEDIRKYELSRHEYMVVEPFRSMMYEAWLENDPDYQELVNDTIDEFNKIFDVRDPKVFGEIMALMDCNMESIQRSKKLQDFIHDFKTSSKGYYVANLIVLSDNNLLDCYQKIYDPKECMIALDFMVRNSVQQLCTRILNSRNIPNVDISVCLAKPISLSDIDVTKGYRFITNVESNYQN